VRVDEEVRLGIKVSASYGWTYPNVWKDLLMLKLE